MVNPVGIEGEADKNIDITKYIIRFIGRDYSESLLM